MRCEQFESFITTGGFVRRRRAIRHALKCLRCAEAWRRRREIEAELRAAAPRLTAAERSLWTAARRDKPQVVASPHGSRPLKVYLTVAAGLLILAIMLLRSWWPSQAIRQAPPIIAQTTQSPEQRIRAPNLTAQPRDVALALPDLADLDRELADLRLRIDLLEAKKEVDALWEQYARPRRSVARADRPDRSPDRSPAVAWSMRDNIADDRFGIKTIEIQSTSSQ
jgi:hypothetical protein